MRILIVDDEAPARSRLRRLIEELGGDDEVVGDAADGESAVAACIDRDADLVMLDVQMPGASGLEIAARLAELEPPPAVILVTAFPEYALDAFEHKVADYLVKPVRRERLMSALQRVTMTTRPQRESEAAPSAPSDKDGRRHLSAHYRGGVQTVPIEDIIYLMAEQKYVTVRHTSGTMLIDESLKALEQEFPDLFTRIHRNALVATEQLIGLEKGNDGSCLAVISGCDERLVVSRRHLPEVRRFLRNC
jgi:two-component system, LytTR family, response regulator AlgR